MQDSPTPGSVLALLQLGDSLFPSGAFTHSLGLEQLVRERLIRDAEQAEAFVASVLSHGVASADAVAVRRAAQAAREGDIEAVIEVDHALLRLKSAAELRAASLATGRRLVEETAPHLEDAMLDEYARRLKEDRQLGTYPVVFGVVACAMAAPSEEVTAALLFGAANALLQAAMRLMPVSHRDVQAVLHRMRPRIVELAARHEPQTALQAFHPLQEIASMRHATSEARLFAS